MSTSQILHCRERKEQKDGHRKFHNEKSKQHSKAARQPNVAETKAKTRQNIHGGKTLPRYQSQYKYRRRKQGSQLNRRKQTVETKQANCKKSKQHNEAISRSNWSRRRPSAGAINPDELGLSAGLKGKD